jgi:hypothetical protein
MRLNFRQGIVSHQPGGFLNLNAGNVDLLAANRAVTLTVADRATNYTFSEDNTITAAWTGPFAPATDYWLYWDFDLLTFARTFGVTTIEPIHQPTAPSSPVAGQIWFDTINDEHFEWNGFAWVKVFRVLAARYNSGSFFSESAQAPLFTGTQIGDVSSVRSGRIFYTEFGDTLRRDDATFFTTEDQFFTNQSTVAAIRLEANVSRAQCIEPAIAAYQIVAYDSEDHIRTAQYADVGVTVIAVLTEDLTSGEVGAVLTQGTVTNPTWDWSALPVGTHMYVDNGELTNVDPHVTDAITNPIAQVPVARILSRDSVIFEQGLGGVGPVGPPGDIENLPPATVSGLGAVALSVASATPTFPVVVGDNDPRLIGGPFASAGHVHPATDISYIPTGGLSSSNVQDAVSELETEKLAISGGTMTGDLFLNGSPTVSLQAATKSYVDSLVFGLVWLEPISFVNLIDNTLNTPPGSPAVSDVYIVGPAGTGLWTGLDNKVVQWDGAAWLDKGLISSYPTGTRFGAAMETSTVPGGTFVGKKDFIFELTVPASGTFDAGTAPVAQTAVLVNNANSLHAFHSYIYSGTAWIEIGGAQPITVDGTTIVQVGNVISTKDFGDGGLVDATTYRGQDLDTVYSALGHTHPGSAITLTAPHIGTNFGTTAVAQADRLVAGTVDLAVQELFDKKANKEPSYAENADLPTAASVAGMIAEVLPGAVDPGLFVARSGAWVKLAVNDGTTQDHDHVLPYDISFFAAGPAASTADAIIGSFLVSRPMTMAMNGAQALQGYCEVAPGSDVTFEIQKNGVSFGNATFLTGSNTLDVADNNFPPAAQTFVVGDRITLVAPSTPEATIEDLSITIIACANMGACPVTVP